MERVELRQNEVIFKDGDYQNWMYSVCEGSVDIYSGYGTSEEKKLTTVTKGQAFGEMVWWLLCPVLPPQLLRRKLWCWKRSSMRISLNI